MCRRLVLALALAIVAGACSGTDSAPPGGSLPPFDVDDFVAELEEAERPVVVNLWASWCIPCRSEAPLLREADGRFGDQVRFLGIATEDVLADSIAFIDEFSLGFENLSDPDGDAKAWASAPGLPVTVFVRPGGEILRTHYGVIDDQTLALGIDDLLRG